MDQNLTKQGLELITWLNPHMTSTPALGLRSHWKQVSVANVPHLLSLPRTDKPDCGLLSVPNWVISQGLIGRNLWSMGVQTMKITWWWRSLFSLFPLHFAAKQLACDSWFHLSFEHSDVISMVDKSTVHGKLFQFDNWNLECWFLGKGENRSWRRKTSWSKEENQQQI